MLSFPARSPIPSFMVDNLNSKGYAQSTQIGFSNTEKKRSFFWMEALIGQSSPFHWLTRRTALDDPTVRLVHLLNRIEWKERQIHLARKDHRTQSKNPLFLDFDHLWATDCLHLLPQNTGITSSKGMPCSHVRSTEDASKLETKSEATGKRP